MSSPGSPSLEIERSARSQYAVVAAVLAILAIVPWWLPRLTVPIAAMLATTTCLLAALSFWRIGWFGGKRVLRKAVLTGDGEWYVFDRAGSRWLATLDPGSQVLGRLLWLRFASERGPRELLLFGADLTPDHRRRLAARLRLRAAQSKLDMAKSELPKPESGDRP